jgi:hypothetical protein
MDCEAFGDLRITTNSSSELEACALILPGHFKADVVDDNKDMKKNERKIKERDDNIMMNKKMVNSEITVNK